MAASRQPKSAQTGPTRYALDVKVERAEDVLTHQRLLKLAEDPATRHVFDFRSVQVAPKNAAEPDHALEEDAQSSSHREETYGLKDALSKEILKLKLPFKDPWN